MEVEENPFDTIPLESKMPSSTVFIWIARGEEAHVSISVLLWRRRRNERNQTILWRMNYEVEHQPGAQHTHRNINIIKYDRFVRTEEAYMRFERRNWGWHTYSNIHTHTERKERRWSEGRQTPSTISRTYFSDVVIQKKIYLFMLYEENRYQLGYQMTFRAF